MSSGDLPALLALTIKMAEKERKLQPIAVPLDTLLERCTMTMHHEISARGSLMPAGDSLEMVPRCFPIPCPRQDSEGKKIRQKKKVRAYLNVPLVPSSPSYREKETRRMGRGTMGLSHTYSV